MVPGSTLMYGSSFCIRTRKPRRSRSMPTDALVSPLPRELTTPPVTKMCLVILNTFLAGKERARSMRDYRSLRHPHSSSRAKGAEAPRSNCPSRRKIYDAASAEKLAAALGGKGVLVVLDGRAALVLGPHDFDDVEPCRIVQQTVRFEKGRRGSGHPTTAKIVDSQSWARARLAAARFHFHKDDSF